MALSEWITGPLEKRYGQKCARRIAQWFDDCQASGEYDCMNSFRTGEKGIVAEEIAFEKKRGCCGSHEDSVIVGDREFLVGFNHGH